MSESSLPTPPGTSHRREKENRAPEFSEPGPSTPRVVWAETNDYRLFEHSAASDFAVPASSLKRPPSRSILKKSSSFNLAIPFPEEEEREVTPEPSDPLVDLNYLDGPVTRILAPDASLRDLIESYSILAARIRASVSDSTDGDASWPLFQPLRTNRDAFVLAMERDLCRALEDPLNEPVINDTSEVEMTREVPMLPSPVDSPRKKRGMTAEQVKYARDLCTTTHSVIKLLGVIFTLPAVCSLFSDVQLRSLLTALLSIPLAPRLPTPNGRKTNALAIWLLSAQRLPEEILAPAASRIAYAIRRGLDGELGKEGKKGSVSDGLKAIHELSMLYPATFVPAFMDLLPSLFPHLIGPAMLMRSHACHALGGLALASAKIPYSSVHERLADHTAEFLAPIPISSPGKGKGVASPSQLSPSKRVPLKEDSFVVRTMRAVLKQHDPRTPSHGPVWALCVMSHLIVLLRTRLFMVDDLRVAICALFNLALSQTKSSVKGLTCIAWRCVFWAWCQEFPTPVYENDSDDDSDETIDEEQLEKDTSRLLHMFPVASSVLDLGTGAGMACSLLNMDPIPPHIETRDISLHLALGVLKNMLRKGGNVYFEAIEILATLASDTNPMEGKEWTSVSKLPPALFEPGAELLVVDYKALPTAVRPIVSRCVDMDEPRNFTDEELQDDEVMLFFFYLLRECVVNHKSYINDQRLPAEVRDIWQSYLRRKYRFLRENGTPEQCKSFAKKVATEVCSILIDDNHVVFKVDSIDNDIILPPTSPKKPTRKPAPAHVQRLLKLKLTLELWVLLTEIFSKEQCRSWATPFLTWLVQNEEEVVGTGNGESVGEARQCWADFCARLCLVKGPSAMDLFWDGKPLQNKREWSDKIKGAVWMEFIKRWQFGESQWEMGIMLLTVPFRSSCTWELTNDQLKEWEESLNVTISQALDSGVDVAVVLDRIARRMHSDTSSIASLVRAADSLLTRLDNPSELPTDLLDLTNDILLRSYPPSPREVVKSVWLLRTLTNLISGCEDSAEVVFRNIGQGVSAWIADPCRSVSEDYVQELGHLYQAVLIAAQTLQTSPYMLDVLTPVLHSAFIGPKDNVQDSVASFTEFWQSTYAEMDEPEDGWPEEIKVCLKAINIPRDDESELESSEVEELIGMGERPRSISPEIELLQPAFEVQPSTPSPKASVRKASVLVKVTEPSPFVTPTKRPSLEFPSLLAPPMSPSSSPSPKRTPVTPKKTPRTARNSSDKENHSPLRAIPSVMDRIMASPSASAFVTPSKKRSRSDSEDTQHTSKRQRRSLGGHTPMLDPIQESTFENALPLSALTSPTKEGLPRPNGPVHGLAPIPAMSFFGKPPTANKAPTSPAKKSSTVSTSTLTSTSTLMKRKSEVLEAVEVPRYKAVRARTSSLPEPKIGPPRKAAQLRRTRSMTKLDSEPRKTESRKTGSTSAKKAELAKAESTRPPLRKRKRVSLSTLSSDDVSPVKVPGYREDMIGSDDSLMMTTPSKYFKAPEYSDDEPWIGQVTPHRLISPSVRRLRKEYDYSDPPSDDSVPSPTSERQARRSGGSAVLSSAAKARLDVYNTPRIPLASLLPVVEDL